ncbi:MAG: DUF5989 family protein [Candidatus Theseobacter exili]|nr:DUF5989 family protein [Candidatus Theseobacter exili]
MTKSDLKKTEGQNNKDFEKQALESTPSFFSELVDFLLNNKKWWLAPIILVLLLLGLLILLGGTGAAPFIYTLF